MTIPKSNQSVGPRTKAVHAGEGPDPITGASAPNIVMSSTFVLDEPVGFSAYDIPGGCTLCLQPMEQPHGASVGG